MRRRGIRRFAVEVVFLAGVAAALTVADLRPAAVIALMAVALVIVWIFEWAAWLDEPHYGRGLPPRFYVPHVALPAPRPIEQFGAGWRQGGDYPVLEAEDAPTFIASTREWAAVLEDWPVADSPGEDTVVGGPDDEDEAVSVVLPPRMHDLEETVAADFELGFEGDLDEVDLEDDVHLEDEETEDPAAVAEPAPAPLRPPPAERGDLPPLELEPRPQTTVLHHVDPLVSTGRRRFRRRTSDEGAIEVLDGPAPDRALPLRLRDESGVRTR